MIHSTHGFSKYSDNTPEEWDKMMGLKNYTKLDMQPVTYEASTVPDSFDWRDRSCVNAVKDQGQCGSCWAFSAIAALETSECAATGTLQSYSEQQLVDCSIGYGNLACSGGWYYYAWDYLMAGHPEETEAQYPYTASRGHCEAGGSGVTPTGYTPIASTP